MKLFYVGDTIDHPHHGQGVIKKIGNNGLADVQFSDRIKTVDLKYVSSERQMKAIHRQRAEASIRRLENEDRRTAVARERMRAEADRAEVIRREQQEQAKREAEERVQAADQEAVTMLLDRFMFDEANQYYGEKCAGWWPLSDYERKQRKAQVSALLHANQFVEAERLYEEHCIEWLPRATYQQMRHAAEFARRFESIYREGSLAELDKLYRQNADRTQISADEYSLLKTARIERELKHADIDLDDEQLRACAQPDERVLVTARAGSGKTRTLCARAVLSMIDEQIDPDQILILAFNTSAPMEVSRRLRKAIGAEITNARTFHSLAYQLVKPGKKLLGDSGGAPSDREQSRFVQRTIERILNPAFKKKMTEYFKQELESIEEMGRDLAPREYRAFRHSLTQVTLGGDSVKSSGEKFIGDFLFEHGVPHQYERVWDWKSTVADGSPYRPDFSLIVDGRDVILEHWALDLPNPHATLPEEWPVTADQYREQIVRKREFWAKKGVPLIETHSGMLRGGRSSFECELASVLSAIGIRCVRLPEDEIERRVFENDYTISRMASLFVQFIQRVKKRCLTVDESVELLGRESIGASRTQMFHQLALRCYREYEKMLGEENAMDFDDLLKQAAEHVEAVGAKAMIQLGSERAISIGDLRWVLVDEYQDFSELYFRLLKAILKANPGIRLFCVGDDWQAINSFAGAEMHFFTNFRDYFPGGATASVSTNYRSCPSIVGAGNGLMSGKGRAAKAYKVPSGGVECHHPTQQWIELRDGDEYSDARKSDSVYLPTGEDGTGGRSRSAIEQAKVFKICADIIIPDPAKTTLLIARTNYVYGLSLEDFKRRLVDIIVKQSGKSRRLVEQTVSVLTAHRSKGHEAHRVIILDATERQFPKIHPDSLLFEALGTTPQAVLDEERRLFYVAASRAEERLYVFTDERAPSPYIDELGQTPARNSSPVSLPRNGLAQQLHVIVERVEAERVRHPRVLNATYPWAQVRRSVPSALHELVDLLGAAGIPIPHLGYTLDAKGNKVVATIAWPDGDTPVAILHGEEFQELSAWRAAGWRVPAQGLPPTEVLRGIRAYVLGEKSKRRPTQH